MIDTGNRRGYAALLLSACLGLSTLTSLGVLMTVSRSIKCSPGAEEVVTAKAFVLLDDSGRVRARLGVNPANQNSGLFLFDAAGHKLAEFDIDQDKSPELQFYGTDTTPKVGVMLLGDHERPVMNLYAESDHNSSYPAVTLGVCEPGSQPSPIKRKSAGRGMLRVYDVDGSETLREGK